jgi:hypothetical protein
MERTKSGTYGTCGTSQQLLHMVALMLCHSHVGRGPVVTTVLIVLLMGRTCLPGALRGFHPYI